jgi:hypothetical protein
VILPDGARRLIKAVAGEGIVKSPQAGNFISKYGLRATSSVKTSLQMLFRIYLTAKKSIHKSAQIYTNPFVRMRIHVGFVAHKTLIMKEARDPAPLPL